MGNDICVKDYVQYEEYGMAKKKTAERTGRVIWIKLGKDGIRKARVRWETGGESTVRCDKLKRVTY